MANALDLHNATVTHKAGVAIMKQGDVGDNVGFVELLLPILIPIATQLLAGCFSKLVNPTGGSPQGFLKANLEDGATDFTTGSDAFIQSHRATGMRAVRISNRGKRMKDRIKPHQVSADNLDAVTRSVFNNVLSSAPQTVTAGYAAALAASQNLQE